MAGRELAVCGRAPLSWVRYLNAPAIFALGFNELSLSGDIPGSRAIRDSGADPSCPSPQEQTSTTERSFRDWQPPRGPFGNQIATASIWSEDVSLRVTPTTPAAGTEATNRQKTQGAPANSSDKSN